MLTKFPNWMEYVLFQQPRIPVIRWLFRLVVFTAILGPLVAIALFSYTYIHRELTLSTLERRQAVAYLGAVTMKARLDRFVDLGTSLAHGTQFRQFVAEGEWHAAVDFLNGAIEDFPVIERILLVDPAGILRSDLPALPGVMGTDFSLSKWYQETTATGLPYISDVYKRGAAPQIKVIAVSVPIRSPAGELAGMLVLQIKLDTFLQWTKEIHVGMDGLLFVVDRRGNIVAHPELTLEERIVSFSHLPVVTKVLQGRRGIDTVYNEEERRDILSAFEPISDYGWGVIVRQSAAAAYAARDNVLRLLVLIYTAIFLLTCILTYFILLLIEGINLQRQRERAFMESIHYGIIGISADQRIILWNETAHALLGWSKEEALGKPLTAICTFTDDDKERSRTISSEESSQDGFVQHVEKETSITTKSGKKLPISLSRTVTLNRQKKMTGSVLLFKDISEVLRARQLLRENEEYSRSIIDTAYDAFISMDEEGRIVDWNLQAARTFGWSGDEIIGKHLSDFIVPRRYRGEHDKGLKHFLHTGQGVMINKRVEIQALHRLGHEFSVELIIWYSKKKGKYFFHAFVHDISQRKAAQESLRLSEERYRSLVETVTDVIFTLSADGIITSLNPAFERITGWSRKEWIGKTFAPLLHPEDLPIVEQRIQRTFMGEDVPIREARYRTKSGGYVIGEGSTIIQRKDGKIVGILGIIRDVTERKKAEVELLKAHQELIKNDQQLREMVVDLKRSHQELRETQLQLIQTAKMDSVGRLAAGVAHEVKNPLAIIQMAVSYLNKKLETNTEIQEILQDIAIAVKRADTIIRGVLDFASPKKLELNPLDINTTIEQALTLLKHDIDVHHVTVSNLLTPGLPHVPVDKNKIEQVFINLIMNAIQAMAAGGTLTIRSFTQQLQSGSDVGYRQTDIFVPGEKVVVIQIDDTGPGIPEHILPRIFDPFFTTKDTGKGFGLGLTICQKILELHQATIHLENIADGGHGTRVTVIFKIEGGPIHAPAKNPDR